MNSNDTIQTAERAVVMGMGISGKAMLEFLLSKNIVVSVTDKRKFQDLPLEDQEYLRKHDIFYEGGEHSSEFMAKGDFIAISPGIPMDLPILETLRQKQIPIFGELALAAPYIKETVIAVTGTNGKTTVTALIGELLRASDKKVFVGGNIGTPLLNYLLSDDQADVLVLELSSFQLEAAGMFCPHIGLLLNITPDHLDRHGTMVKYAAAKMKMFSHQKAQDKAIICSNDPMCQFVGELLNGQESYCFGDEESKCAATITDMGINVSLKERCEDYGLEGTVLDSYTGALNSAAAILAVTLLDCQKKDIERGLNSFSLAKHRLQHVKNRFGVAYYNDSKATNTGAVLSALNSFSGNILLIAGGRDKGEEYLVLKEVIAQRVKELILIGEAADSIATAMDAAVKIIRAGSMEEAVSLAAASAVSGDTVLLAPACSSFDMFDNYGHRGEVYMQAVHGLSDVEERSH